MTWQLSAVRALHTETAGRYQRGPPFRLPGYKVLAQMALGYG